MTNSTQKDIINSLPNARDKATLRIDPSTALGFTKAVLFKGAAFFTAFSEFKALNLGVWGRVPRSRSFEGSL